MHGFDGTSRTDASEVKSLHIYNPTVCSGLRLSEPVLDVFVNVVIDILAQNWVLSV